MQDSQQLMKREPTSLPGTWGGMEFVPIPAGAFVMGSLDEDELAFEDEKPQHCFEIAYDYWTARFPVNNRQFAEFVRSTGFSTRAEREGRGLVWESQDGQWQKKVGACWRHPLGAGSSLVGLEDHPVVQVCWYDALAFCE